MAWRARAYVHNGDVRARKHGLASQRWQARELYFDFYSYFYLYFYFYAKQQDKDHCVGQALLAGDSVI